MIQPCDYCGGYNIVEDGFAPRCQDTDCTGETDSLHASGKLRHPLAALFEGQDVDDAA